jgi:hypothetical protein
MSRDENLRRSCEELALRLEIPPTVAVAATEVAFSMPTMNASVAYDQALDDVCLRGTPQ